MAGERGARRVFALGAGGSKQGGTRKCSTAVVAQLFAIFAFGLLITGVVFLRVVRAREVAERVARTEAAVDRSRRET